jgi:hypothetical protein
VNFDRGWEGASRGFDALFALILTLYTKRLLTCFCPSSKLAQANDCLLHVLSHKTRYLYYHSDIRLPARLDCGRNSQRLVSGKQHQISGYIAEIAEVNKVVLQKTEHLRNK